MSADLPVTAEVAQRVVQKFYEHERDYLVQAAAESTDTTLNELLASLQDAYDWVLDEVAPTGYTPAGDVADEMSRLNYGRSHRPQNASAYRSTRRGNPSATRINESLIDHLGDDGLEFVEQPYGRQITARLQNRGRPAGSIAPAEEASPLSSPTPSSGAEAAAPAEDASPEAAAEGEAANKTRRTD